MFKHEKKEGHVEEARLAASAGTHAAAIWYWSLWLGHFPLGADMDDLQSK